MLHGPVVEGGAQDILQDVCVWLVLDRSYNILRLGDILGRTLEDPSEQIGWVACGMWFLGARWGGF